jgi:hypothetical protein
MSTTKPTIVLISGGFHQASAWNALLPYLHNRSYPTLTLSLPSLDAAEPLKASIESDIAQLRPHIETRVANGEELVVVFHSFGGVAGAGAVSGLSKVSRSSNGVEGGVIGAIWLCAIVIPSGTTAEEYLGTKAQQNPNMIYDTVRKDFLFFF